MTPEKKSVEQPDLVPQKKDTLPPAPSNSAEGFVLKGVKINGATVFTKDDLAKTYKDYLGLKADLNTIQFIAGRITQMYRDEGYLLSKAIVPEQQVDDGVATIVVVEGYVSQVRLDGDDVPALQKKDSFKLLQKITKHITEMRPLHGPSLEQLLLRINDLSGIETHAVLEALPREQASPGAVGMVIQVKSTPRDINVSIDNFGSRYAGPVEMSGNISFSNTLVAFDRTSLAVLTAVPTKEVKVGSVEYSLPVTDFGTSIDTRMGYSTLVPGYTLQALDVRSKSFNAGVKVSQNLLHTRKDNASVSAGIDMANSATTYLGNELYKDRIRALRLAGQYTRADSFGGTSNGSVTLSHGLDFLGSKKTGSSSLSRATGHSDFTKIAASLSRVQQLGSVVQLYGAATGQYSWDPLLSSEEFGYGGQAFGRAYDASEITGDSGIAAALELRYTGTPEVYQTILQPFAFYDIGKVWKPDAEVGSRILSGASTGMGMKFLYDQRISGYLAVAEPLTKPATAPPSYSKGDGPRVLLQISSHF